MDTIAAARIKGAKTVSLICWLSAVALGLASLASKAAGYWLLGNLLLGLAVIAGIFFACCVVFLMVSAAFLIITGAGNRDGA